MKKFIAIAAILCLVSIVCIMLSKDSPVEGGELLSKVWVDDDWAVNTSGDTVYWEGNLSQPHIFGTDAFAKIQHGIDAVSGSIVHVADGTYYENIVLKDGVELWGNGTATFTIDHFSVFAVTAGAAAADQPNSDAAATSAPASTASPSYSSNDSGGLSAAEWAGIAVGVIVLIMIFIWIFMRWRRNWPY